MKIELAAHFLAAMKAKKIRTNAEGSLWEIAIIGNGTVELEYWLLTETSLERVEHA